MSGTELDRVWAAILPAFRRPRMARFCATFAVDDETRILDVGGTPFNWSLVDVRPAVTLLNPTPPPRDLAPNLTHVEGDGREIPFQDGSFDIAFSNSVIEHLGRYEEQERFAREVRRVAPSTWVQTPARSFVVEPHLLTPGVHLLPRSLQRWILRRATVWGIATRPSSQDVDRFLAEIRLLTAPEMRRLFPDCRIEVERFAGLPKSYVAVRRARDSVDQLDTPPAAV